MTGVQTCALPISGRLIAEALGLKKDDYIVTFQSRFGKAEWLQPYTDKTLESLGKNGTKRIDIICPGFAADCLETLEEIADEGRETFLHAGGNSFNYLPIANDTPAYVGALTEVARQHLQGWVSDDGSFDRDGAARANEMSAMRARELLAKSESASQK